MLESISIEQDRIKAKNNCDLALQGKNHVSLEIYGNLTRQYYETRYNSIYDQKGTIIGVTILSSNVTERMEAEKQLNELNKELESFSYSVSHDLRAPLRAVTGYTRILEEEYKNILDAEGMRILCVIQQNAKKMETLIDELLAFSRLGKKELSKASIDMNVIVDGSLHELKKENTHKVQIKREKLHPANGDFGLINQVVINLLSNAFKFSAKSDNPIIEITSIQTTHEVIYQFKDNGAGFDMSHVDKL